MHVFLVQVDVIVGPLQGAEFQYLMLGNMGRFLRAFLFGSVCSLWSTSRRFAERFTTALCGI